MAYQRPCGKARSVSIVLVNPRSFSLEQNRGHVFITDLRLSTVLRTKSSTEEDDKDRQLEENKEERKQQKWRFKGDEIGACLFDAKDPERYVYFARNAVLELHDRRKTTNSSSDDEQQQAKSKIISRTFSDDISALALDPKYQRMAIADDSGDVNVVSLVMKEDGGEEFPLVQTFKIAHGDSASSGCATAVSFRAHKPDEVISAGYDCTVKKWEINRKSKEVNAWKIKEIHSARTENEAFVESTSTAFNPPFINSMKCWEEDSFGSRNSSSTISSNSSTNNNGSMKRLCVVARGDGIVSVLDLDGKKRDKIVKFIEEEYVEWQKEEWQCHAFTEFLRHTLGRGDERGRVSIWSYPCVFVRAIFTWARRFKDHLWRVGWKNSHMGLDSRTRRECEQSARNRRHSGNNRAWFEGVCDSHGQFRGRLCSRYCRRLKVYFRVYGRINFCLNTLRIEEYIRYLRNR